MTTAAKTWLVDCLSQIPSLRMQRIARLATWPFWWLLRDA